MAEKIYEFGFGDAVIKLALPEEKVIYEIEGRSVPAITDINEAVKAALRNPIDSPPLTEVVKPGDKVVIVVSDITRAWGKFDQFLPTLLDEINAAGVPDSDIDIVISLGSHRPHTQHEDKVVCGESVCHRVKIHQHDANDPEKLVYTGTTSRGVKCYLNKTVAQADKVILTGGIVYHLMVGFGGGRKSIIPGVSGYTTIQDNHCFTLHPEVGKGLNPECASGKLVGNPAHEDMLEATAFAKPAFLLNAVFTPEGKFAKFFAGHWLKAWEIGTKAVEEIYGIPIDAQADLVIASAGGFPKDINLYQGSKSIDNAYMAVKTGGVVICFLECRDIYEPPEFSDWFKYENMLELELALRKAFTVPGFIALKLSDIARKVSLIIVTKPENAEFIKNAGMIPATTAEEAMAIAKEKLGREDYTITVMGHAANTVPLLKV
ncbi:Lactate racemase [Sporomusa carbonis]|uniref:nickel-dependent lactate racemase n=1 Tax=Sporomusa carbonis TaxID=3076075 RepID=UPI003A6F9903